MIDIDKRIFILQKMFELENQNLYVPGHFMEATKQLISDVLDAVTPPPRRKDGVLYTARKLRAMNGMEGYYVALIEIKERREELGL
jgi:hypothetical protein